MTNVAIDLFDAFATDPKKEVEGAETEIPGCGSTKFLVARVGSAAYKRILNTLYKKHKAVLESNSDEAQNISDKVMAEVYAKTVLLGWSGTVRYKGQDLPYSEANAKTLLQHKDFRAIVEGVAGDLNAFKVVSEAEEVKN